MNARSLRNRGHAARLLRDLLSFGVDVAAVHDGCDVDIRVLSSDLSSIQQTGTGSPGGVSLLPWIQGWTLPMFMRDGAS